MKFKPDLYMICASLIMIFTLWLPWRQQTYQLTGMELSGNYTYILGLVAIICLFLACFRTAIAPVFGMVQLAIAAVTYYNTTESLINDPVLDGLKMEAAWGWYAFAAAALLYTAVAIYNGVKIIGEKQNADWAEA